MSTIDENYADAAPPDSTPEAEGDGEETQGETALIPISLCPGMEVGDKIELRIVAKHEDDYSVAYEKGAEKEEAKEPESKPEPPGDAEMQSMMS